MTPQALELVKGYYLRGKEKSPQEAYARACVAYSDGDTHLAQRLYDAVSKGWFMFSSPILSNAPFPDEEAKGLPISCFLSYVPDTLEGLIEHQAELAWLSVKGGGVGGHWSDVRAVSDKAPSPIPFIKVADSAMTAYKQGREVMQRIWTSVTQMWWSFLTSEYLREAIAIASALTLITLLILPTILLVALSMAVTGIWLTLTMTVSGSRLMLENYGRGFWRRVLGRVNRTSTSLMMQIGNYLRS
jgi:hypothetical protein